MKYSKGFSLIEALVAIAILGVSLGMLYQAAGGAVRSVSTSEDYAYAVELAQSLMAMNSKASLSGVSANGQTEDGYHWSVSSDIYAQDDTGQPSLYAVLVSIRWGSVVRPRVFELRTIAPVGVDRDAN